MTLKKHFFALLAVVSIATMTTLAVAAGGPEVKFVGTTARSEERRVGKEC